jgi:hypothetical protein
MIDEWHRKTGKTIKEAIEVFYKRGILNSVATARCFTICTELYLIPEPLMEIKLYEQRENLDDLINWIITNHYKSYPDEYLEIYDLLYTRNH